MKRKLAAAVLLAALCGALLSAGEAEAFSCGGWEYILAEDGTAVITGYAGEDFELEIPALLDGHAVGALGESLFAGSWSLTEVTVPYGVTEIGDFAFYGCPQLEKVVLPDSVTVIGKAAFAWTPLREMTLPAGVAVIGDQAFYRCEYIAEIGLPEGLAAIGGGAFGATGLSSVTIPDSVTDLGDIRGNTAQS